MDATALRTAQTIRTVRDVTPSVIVLRMNYVTPWWAVLILLLRHILLEQRLHDKAQTPLQTTSAAVLGTTLVIDLDEHSTKLFLFLLFIIKSNTYLRTFINWNKFEQALLICIILDCMVIILLLFLWTVSYKKIHGRVCYKIINNNMKNRKIYVTCIWFKVRMQRKKPINAQLIT